MRYWKVVQRNNNSWLALRECANQIPALDLRRVPLLLCVAETERPGRLAGLDQNLLVELQAETGLAFHPKSGV